MSEIQPPASPGPGITALVLGGGVSLGAYEAGVYAALHDSGRPALDWVAGSSIGAITAAIVAGNAPERRIPQLRQFWRNVTADPLPISSFWFGPPTGGVWRQMYNQASVVQTLLFGRPGIFRPRLFPAARVGAADVSALYDLQPLREQLDQLVDFDRLNQGDPRLTLAATDVMSGERVVFDSTAMTIGPEHVLASCALLPLFAPVEIEGRLLGDGGLSSNVPLDLVLAGAGGRPMLCFVVDLFAQEGSRPHSLAASLSRSTDLMFGNQTRRMLEAQEREHRLRTVIARLGERLPPELRGEAEVAAMLAEGREHPATVVYLSFRAALDEAGAGKVFDFSRLSLADRWATGEADMQRALQQLASAT